MKVDIIELRAGHLPVYKHESDCCCDCKASLYEDVILNPRCMVTIPLGFKLGLPKGYEAQIRPRSGLARNNGVMAVFGTIDEEFRGEVGTTLINNSDVPFTIHNGDRICQMKIEKKEEVIFNVVSELSNTERGECGWGSTGV